jgi:hypothetical protein
MGISLSFADKSKVLEEVIVELKKKNVNIPANVLSDLKAARTLITVEKADLRGRSETEPKIDEYLSNVEIYALAEAEKHFPAEKVEMWLASLNAGTCSCSCCETCTPTKEAETEKEGRYVTGVPRDQKWVRIQPIEGLDAEKIVQMATQAGLSAKTEANQNVVVYGQPEALREFIKKVTGLFGKKSKS